MNPLNAQSAYAMTDPVAVVDRAALESALAYVNRVVEKRNSIPILSNVRLTGLGGALRVVGTDLDMEAAASVPGAADTAFDVTVPAELLYKLTAKRSSGMVELRADEAHGLAVDFEGPRATLNTLPARDFPDMIFDPAGEVSFSLPADALREAFAIVSPAISTEETRYYLNGIFMHVPAHEPNVLRFVATDGHRMHLHDVPAPDGSLGLTGTILPRAAVAEIARALPKAGKRKPKEGEAEPEVVTFQVTAAKTRVTLPGGRVLTTKNIDGTFPDYHRILPTGNDRILRVDRAQLVEAIGYVRTVSHDRAKAVRLDIEPGKVTLAVHNPDQGSAVESIPADYDGDALPIGFNGSYLTEILAMIAPAEVVEMRLASPGSPTMMRAAGCAATRYVLMPMRI